MTQRQVLVVKIGQPAHEIRPHSPTLNTSRLISDVTPGTAAVLHHNVLILYSRNSCWKTGIFRPFSSSSAAFGAFYIHISVEENF